MGKRRVEVIKLDNTHHIYVYSRKVIYKEKKNGKWTTRVSSSTLSDLLDSDLVSEDVKKKLKRLLEKSSSFFNRG